MADNDTDIRSPGSLPITKVLSGCRHCDAVKRELERCAPLTPSGAGSWPSWGAGPLVDLDAPASRKIFGNVGACSCECHEIWRFIQRGPR